jgi:ATP-dependent protease HslVU (ClpYQ) peptidase subunit
MAEPVIPFIDMLKCIQKIDAVLVVIENGFLFITARGDVVDGTGVFYAEGSGHAATVS